MMKKLIPTFKSNNIFNVDFVKLKELGYKTLFIDLDNTLDSPYVYSPDSKVFSLIEKLKDLNFNIYIVSNNKQERVERYVKDLNVNYMYDVKKPFVKRIRKFIKENNIDLSHAISIGDQVMTDVLLANKLKISVILLNPLTIKDEPITFIPRLLDKHFRKKINKLDITKEI